MIVVSAQQLLTTRNCAAEQCENEADTNSRLCWRCAKRDSVTLHITPPQDGPTLKCTTCHQWKHDADYSQKSSGNGDRRGRHSECKDCCNARRRLARTTLTPEKRALRQAAERRRRARLRADLQRIREAHHDHAG